MEIQIAAFNDNKELRGVVECEFDADDIFKIRELVGLKIEEMEKITLDTYYLAYSNGHRFSTDADVYMNTDVEDSQYLNIKKER